MGPVDGDAVRSHQLTATANGEGRPTTDYLCTSASLPTATGHATLWVANEEKVAAFDERAW